MVVLIKKVAPTKLEKYRSVWYSVFCVILLAIYIRGLWIPLMHNDSAHHANIALHMFTTGDYVSLIDRETDYLDKPHFLFWTAAVGYKVFGVFAFAYKVTSLLFGFLCLYATHQLAKLFYNSQVALYAILILATTYSFVLAFSDVRMDAILTGTITFSIWQLLLLSKSQKFKHVLGSALGLSLGFSTKGALGIAIPLVAVAIYLAQENSLQKLLAGKWIIMAILTLAFMSPVLYCYYLQFDLYSGKSGISYILLGQSLERLTRTTSGVQGSNDAFFYLHTFLWTALPWTILGIISWATVAMNLIKGPFSNNKNDVFLFLFFTVMILLLSAASSKLPHYLNIIFPFLSLLIASYIFRADSTVLRKLRIVQQVLILLLLISGVVTFYFFPAKDLFITVGFTTLMALVAIMFFAKISQESEKIMVLTCAGSLLLFFVMNFHFYPSVLDFQGGKVLAEKILHEGIPIDRIAYLSNFETANDFDFQLKKNIPSVDLSNIISETKPLYIVSGDMGYQALKSQGFSFEKIAEVSNYRVSKLNLKFLDPATRKSVLGKLYLLKTN